MSLTSSIKKARVILSKSLEIFLDGRKVPVFHAFVAFGSSVSSGDGSLGGSELFHCWVVKLLDS
jgi:hypothetical protein